MLPMSVSRSWSAEAAGLALIAATLIWNLAAESLNSLIFGAAFPGLGYSSASEWPFLVLRTAPLLASIWASLRLLGTLERRETAARGSPWKPEAIRDLRFFVRWTSVAMASLAMARFDADVARLHGFCLVLFAQAVTFWFLATLVGVNAQLRLRRILKAS